MKKKYGIGLLAIVIAVGAAAFAFPAKTEVKKAPLGPFYFEFAGSHGGEANVANWIEITQSKFDSAGCPEDVEMGCRLKTDQKDITGLHPLSVPVDASDVPQVQSPHVPEVKNTRL